MLLRHMGDIAMKIGKLTEDPHRKMYLMRKPTLHLSVEWRQTWNVQDPFRKDLLKNPQARWQALANAEPDKPPRGNMKIVSRRVNVRHGNLPLARAMADKLSIQNSI